MRDHLQQHLCTRQGAGRPVLCLACDAQCVWFRMWVGPYTTHWPDLHRVLSQCSKAAVQKSVLACIDRKRVINVLVQNEHAAATFTLQKGRGL